VIQRRFLEIQSRGGLRRPGPRKVRLLLVVREAPRRRRGVLLQVAKLRVAGISGICRVILRPLGVILLGEWVVFLSSSHVSRCRC
jgi:hypothetical protein